MGRGGKQVEAVKQAAIGGLGAGDGGAACAGDGDKALGPASAFGRGTAVTQGAQALILHAVQRGVERSGRGIAASLSGDFGEDGDTVSLTAKSQNG